MSDNIKVVVKVRPLITREIEEKLSYQWRVNNNTLYQLDQNGKDFGQVFTFDKVYDKETETSNVYNDIAKPIVEAATTGINGTIFAYGQTSSGKTYTMTGTDNSLGIIQLAVLNLFDIIKNIPNRDFLVRVSYIEIYNETVKDLLNMEKDYIKIYETLQGIKVDATEKVASSPEEVLEAMKQGELNRQTGATNMNEKSSRSHTIFQIIIESRDHVEGEEEAGSVNVSHLNLVDLAGSERAGQTGAKGIRFKEGTLINKSLSALALVIKQLSEDPNKFVNYRDSKLTRILQNSLGGNAKTSIICAITPAAIEETISTLQFANRAKAIKNKPEVNEVATDATMIQSLTKKLYKLQERLKNTKRLEVLLASKENVEQENHNLQKQIAALQKLMLNAFDRRSNVDVVTSRRKNPHRRFTVSALEAIKEDPTPKVPQFCTPALKYNPMTIPGVTELVPVQESNNLFVFPEEPYRSVTPPSRDKRVDFDDVVVVLDSDDDEETSAQSCSPYHKCYDTKTPPCVLRKTAIMAEKNFRDIVELTEREKIYSPQVHELMDKLEDYNKIVLKLKDEIEELTEKSKTKDAEIDELREKIKKSEEQIQNITKVKTNLEAECSNYNIKLTDWEFSYENLKKKAKLREEELLSLLEDQSLKTTDSSGSLSKNIEKEQDNFVDNISKELFEITNSKEVNNVHRNEEYSPVDVKISDLQSQLADKDQRVLELESNFCVQKERIEFLENSTQKLQLTIDNFKEKLANVEAENSLHKITIDNLNSTIKSQKSSLDIPHEAIQELEILLTGDENRTNIDVSDTVLDKILANEEIIFANKENIKNIIYSFKTVLENKNREISNFKTTDTIYFKQDIENKSKCIENLNLEIHKLQEQVKENVTTINKLIREKNNFINLEQEINVTEKLNNDFKIINEKNIDEISTLKELNESLLLQITNCRNEEQKIISSDNNLSQKVNDMITQITNLEKDIKQKDDLIIKLKTEDAKAQEHLYTANIALSKLKNVIRMITGDIEDVPEVIDNFVNVFNILCNGLNYLETTAVNITSEKEKALKDLLEFQKKYNILCNKHDEKVRDLLKQIDQLVENEKSLITFNENISQQLEELKTEMDTNSTQNTNLQMQLSSLKDENLNLKNCLLSKENIISALKENENKLLNTMEGQISQAEKTNMEQDIYNLKTTLKSKEKMFEEILQLKEQNISELSSKLKLIENSINDRDNKLKKVFDKVCLLSNNLNMSNSFSYDLKDNNMNEIIVSILDKITNHVIQTRDENTHEKNYEVILAETQKQIKELNIQNMNLMNKLSQVEENNFQLTSEIRIIQTDNISLSGDLTTSSALLEHLQHELKLKHDELDQMVEKVRDWKDQFLVLDTTMKKHIDDLNLENENLKMRCVDLKNDTEDKIKHLTEKPFEEYSLKDKVKLSEDITTTRYSPKSLLTLCCSTIVDYIQPRDNASEYSISANSNTESEIPRVDTPVKKCVCDQLSTKLTVIQNENRELTNTINQLKFVNHNLMNELEEVRTEVQLLIEPAYELQKKIIGHRTNLSILTATTYAENKSLISQVKGLQHHHNRFHNVCQRDIPAFKKQLCELLSILKDNASVAQNTTLKRYSLPDVFDNNNTLKSLRNESTLDGDLLMLDTNVTLTTSDNTLVGCDQTCLDLTQTLYNEVSCQTNEINMPSELKSQLELLSNDNENMIDLLEILKQENVKLREKVDLFSKEKNTRENVNSIENEIINISNTCVKCEDINKFKVKLSNMESEHKDIYEKLLEVKRQKVEIEQKYNALKMDIPNTDGMVKKIEYLEQDCNTKANEIIQLTKTLSNKSKELQFLQDENITLSTQVMENISETDDLNKELDKLKQQNTELVEKCIELKNYKFNEAKCTQCDLKDKIISNLQVKCISESRAKQKLNRSYSDSDTSSRYNKICTLQSELNAGREDCKELTEDFTTIKHHLERSNISMDLDESIGDSAMNTHRTQSVNYSPKSPQMSTCIMPDIPEELPLDDYVIEKMECLNYYIEKIGYKNDLNDNVKIVDLMKMFYENLIGKHGGDTENLSNKLKDYEKSCSELQTKMCNITYENQKITEELKTKEKESENLAHIISSLKSNIIIIGEEIEKPTKPNKNEKIVNLFKENILKIVDTEFGLTSVNIFSCIDSIIRKNEYDLNEALENYNKLQDHMLELTSELASARDDLTVLKSQLNDKDNEYKLLMKKKEKIHEISNAVTLDIVRREQSLNEIVSKHLQKLVTFNIIDLKAIDTQSYVNNTVDFMLEHLDTLVNNISEAHSDRDKLTQEVEHLKTNINYKDNLIDNLKAQNVELLETIEKTNINLMKETNKLRELNSLHEELSKVYNSKVEENNMNFSLIKKLTEEIEILKKDIVQHEETVNSLADKEDIIRDLITKIKILQEDNSRLKSANEFINKEKDAYAIELEQSGKTIKQNNVELDRMTSDILGLRESIKENTVIIENLKDEAKLLLKQNLELKEQFEGKCQDCTRLEINIKTHEKTADIQNRIIQRLQKQKDELDILVGQKDKQLEELNVKFTTIQNNYEELYRTKESLEVRVADLETEGKCSGNKHRSSIDRRRQRQSLHDSKRSFNDDINNFEDSNSNNPDTSTLERIQKRDEHHMMDLDDDSNRSTPIRLSKGRDSLQSRTDQSERDEEHSSRPGSVLATRKRRQSSHDLHRSVIQTPSSFDNPTHKLYDEVNTSRNSEQSGNNDAKVLQLSEKLASCLEELEDLKEKYKELDEECEICAEYLHEREDQCIRLKDEKTVLEAQLAELKEKMQSNLPNLNTWKREFAHVSVNTDEDWTNLHSVVVDRMSYDAEVDKNKRLVKIIEDLRYSKQDLQNTLNKMQQALEKHAGKDNNRELEAAKIELQQRNEELEELRQRYKELDEECDTCAEYLKEKEEQCCNLKEAKAALEAKLRDIQEESACAARAHSARKKRQTVHDLNRGSGPDLVDASTQIGDDFLNNQVDRDDNPRRGNNETPSKELKRLKKALDVLVHQKAALENQLHSLSSIPHACPTKGTVSTLVQRQQLKDAMNENQKLKKFNAKLISICKKRGKPDANRENEYPTEQD